MKSALQIRRLRAALVRLLWDSIADEAACSCSPGDLCPQCQAMQALGFPKWPGPKRAADQLREMR